MPPFIEHRRAASAESGRPKLCKARRTSARAAAGFAILLALGVYAPAGRCHAAGAAAPAAISLIPADRTTVWNPGLNAVGGAPQRTTVCATIEASRFGSGMVDASTYIQAALASCPKGQVVQLSAGVFRVDNLILIDRAVTLRGAGAQATILKKTNGAVAGVDHGESDSQPVILIGSERWPKSDDARSVSLLADGEKGASSVVVSGNPRLQTGDLVLIDSDEYGAASWTALPNRAGRATGERIFASDRTVFMRHNPPDEAADDPIPDSLSWFSRPGRPVSEVKEVAAVDGDRLSFTTPLHIGFPRAKASQVTPLQCKPVTFAGVEFLGVVGGSDDAVRFECAAYAWVKGIEVSVWEGSAISLDYAFRVEVRDSYVHDAAFSTPGGGAYAITFERGSSDALIENNIVVKTNKAIVARGAGAGSVVAYNYIDDGFIAYDQGWQEVGLSGSHYAGSHSMLFEGNEAFNYDSDNTHGNAIYMTVFRNHLLGFRRDFADAANIRAAGLNYGSWWHSFIGNVLGSAGRMQGWTLEDNGENSNDRAPFHGGPSIWRLGYQADRWDQAGDPKVLATLVRQGNYDFLTRSVQWEGPELPLPDSLYLAGKPAFFGTHAWPWVDPIGAVKVHELPAKARYEAGAPFAAP